MIDLKVFILFYVILITLFSMIFAVIGVGNPNFKGNAYWNFLQNAPEDYGPLPHYEYEQIGLFYGYIISTFRMSLGDFDFEASMYLSTWENYMFWLYWFFVVLFTCIIFLNFIIAETSSSYLKVKETVDA
jgi:hypothetical protein